MGHRNARQRQGSGPHDECRWSRGQRSDILRRLDDDLFSSDSRSVDNFGSSVIVDFVKMMGGTVGRSQRKVDFYLFFVFCGFKFFCRRCDSNLNTDED